MFQTGDLIGNKDEKKFRCRWLFLSPNDILWPDDDPSQRRTFFYNEANLTKLVTVVELYSDIFQE